MARKLPDSVFETANPLLGIADGSAVIDCTALFIGVAAQRDHCQGDGAGECQ
jgi:hypothetical protein